MGRKLKAKSVLDLSAGFYESLRGAAKKGRGRAKVSGWPMLSDALKVHPMHRQHMIDDAKAKGVPTEFTKDGRPVLTSRDHQRRYCRAYGFHNHDDSWSGRHD